LVPDKSDPPRELASEAWLRRILSAALLWFQRRRRQSFDRFLGEDAWIVAPHPDDEVLGCGGTILRKRRLGAEVRVVFLTDGEGSHPDALSAKELATRRRDEAIRACRALNVTTDRVFFLGLTDGALKDQIDACVTNLSDLFARHRAGQFFVPHRMEPPSDHKAAWCATTAALDRLQMQATVLEYSVWCWDRWPFVRLGPGGGVLRRVARRARDMFWAMSWLFGCRAWVDVSDVADAKNDALAKHVSQMHGLPEAPNAPTLRTLRNGDFIERLLGPYEIFDSVTVAASTNTNVRTDG